MAPLYSVFTIAGYTAVRAHTARQLDTGLGIVTFNTVQWWKANSCDPNVLLCEEAVCIAALCIL